MNRNRSWKPRAQSPRFRTARAVNAHVLGKATENVKLELPEALRRELEILAAQDGKALSDYLRGVLARELLGEGFCRRWQAALAEAHTG
jgi:plasmid stability protein